MAHTFCETEHEAVMGQAPDPSLKGKLNGNCNRTACQMPGAVFQHVDLRFWYCESCARDINEFAERVERWTLFLLDKPGEEAPSRSVMGKLRR